ncbi:MAG: hypothetical protein IJ262_06370 [Clostridia bacterium]|nr:hypothetical protein [Clostridia bacterium]
MAKCPNCQKKLHIWNIKAECPHCKVNIPNFEWEKRLEEEAYIREESYFKLNSKLKKISFSAVGTPLRIARLAFSFIPIVAYLLPLGSFSITSGESTFALNDVSLLSLILDLIKNKTLDLGGFISFLTAQASSGNFAGILAVVFYILSLVIGIIAFFCVPFACKKLRTPLHAILHLLSTVLFAVSPVLFSSFCSALPAASEAVCSGKNGIYVGIALFALVSVLDIIIAATPLNEKDGKYIPTDELQREYAISIGAIKEDEYPDKKEKKAKK